MEIFFKGELKYEVRILESGFPLRLTFCGTLRQMKARRKNILTMAESVVMLLDRWCLANGRDFEDPDVRSGVSFRVGAACDHQAGDSLEDFSMHGEFSLRQLEAALQIWDTILPAVDRWESGYVDAFAHSEQYEKLRKEI